MTYVKSRVVDPRLTGKQSF